LLNDLLQQEALKILKEPPEAPKKKLSPIQASDEIVSLFCMLHGGIETAMPMVRTQFFGSYVDFENPPKKGLIRVVDGLIGITEFLKGKEIAEMARERYKFYLDYTEEDKKE
jgi:tetrahydromethanopterin S-methyltransferase subunit E